MNTDARPRLIPCALAVLGPIVLLLALSHAIWGGGQACYLFWESWNVLHPAVTLCARLATDWGNPLAYAIYGLILIRAMHRKNRDDLRFVLCYIIVQLVIALVLTNVLKNAFGLPRPYVDATEARPWSFKSMYQSFPSGHTAEIVGAVLPLALRWPRPAQAVLCGLWIAAVGYSRVYLGRHYLMDIWGGIAIGGLAALSILYLAGKKFMNDTPQASSGSKIHAPDQSSKPGEAIPMPATASPAGKNPNQATGEGGAGEKIFSLLVAAGLLTPLLLAAAQVCLGLDTRSLWFSDEVRHGAVYEAMRQSGNWLMLTLNGDLYPDKPPLYFWFLYLLDAIPELDPPRLFLAANALCGLLFTAATWLLARGLGYDKRTSLAASLILLSTFSFLGITHYARMDLLFATCIVLSQLCLCRGWVKDSAPIWLILGFVLAALACLIKGPLGLAFPLASSLIFLVWRATFRRAGGGDGALAFGSMLLILLAWASLVLLQEGGRDYLTSMFGRHMIERAMDAWHHKQLWWFYLLSLPLAWLPWTLVVFFLPWERLPGLLKAAGPARRETPGHGWTWIALASGLLILSVLSGKVAIYALPLYPFLAILTA
jgi:membrane-associated phospholipid phosphatase